MKRRRPPFAATRRRRQGNCVHNLSVSCIVFVRTVRRRRRELWPGKGARKGGVAEGIRRRFCYFRAGHDTRLLIPPHGRVLWEVRVCVYVRACMRLRACTCVRARMRPGPSCRGNSGRHIHLRPPPHPPRPPLSPLAFRCHHRKPDAEASSGASGRAASRGGSSDFSDICPLD